MKAIFKGKEVGGGIVAWEALVQKLQRKSAM